jgi:hypothetical protein
MATKEFLRKEHPFVPPVTVEWIRSDATEICITARSSINLSIDHEKDRSWRPDRQSAKGSTCPVNLLGALSWRPYVRRERMPCLPYWWAGGGLIELEAPHQLPRLGIEVALL